MREIGSVNETQQEVRLREGTHGYRFPNFPVQSAEKMEARLNEFLASIDSQGGRLLGVIHIQTAYPVGTVHPSGATVTTPFVIVSK